MSSLDTGKIPEGWIVSFVVPLIKMGSRNNPGNHRLANVVLVAEILWDIWERIDIKGQSAWLHPWQVVLRTCEYFEVPKLIEVGRAMMVY